MSGGEGREQEGVIKHKTDNATWTTAGTKNKQNEAMVFQEAECNSKGEREVRTQQCKLHAERRPPHVFNTRTCRTAFLFTSGDVGDGVLVGLVGALVNQPDMI